jgi:hypothetical protein
MVLKDLAGTRKHYKLGRDAEKRQLPMFLPYKSLVRDCLALVVDIRPSTVPQASSTPTAAATTSLSLTPPDSSRKTDRRDVVDVRRHQIRLKHRGCVSDSRGIRQSGMATMSTTLAGPPKNQRASQGGGGEVRTILIRDMDLTKDEIYHGCLIYGTIIGPPSVMVGLNTGNNSPLSEFSSLCPLIADLLLNHSDRGHRREGGEAGSLQPAQECKQGDQRWSAHLHQQSLHAYGTGWKAHDSCR